MKEHHEKVKLCKDKESCARTTCWYRHKQIKPIEANTEAEDQWVNSGLDNENEDFHKAPMQPKPPLNV